MSKPEVSKCGKYYVVTRMTGRGKRTTYIPKAEADKAAKRKKGACGVRVVIDGKLQALPPEHILFGPGYKDLPPHATPDWNPENHKDYYKRYK